MTVSGYACVCACWRGDGGREIVGRGGGHESRGGAMRHDGGGMSMSHGGMVVVGD